MLDKQPQKQSISTIILAGGRSSRMGQDKALMKIGSLTLLEKTCILASEYTHPVYAIAQRTEKYHHLMPPGCYILRESLLPGKTETSGPLIAFAQGLAVIDTDWVLLLACDLPNLTSSVLKKWLEHLDKVSIEALALLPKQKKGWEPLCGFYRCSCLPMLNDFIEEGGRSFQAWLKNYSVEELPVNEPSVLFNCNTPEDWEKFHNL